MTLMNALTTSSEVGSALRFRRTTLHLTQQEVADRAGVSRPWLVRLERGHPAAELGKVLAVARALQLVVDLPVEPEPDADLDLDQVLRDLTG